MSGDNLKKDLKKILEEASKSIKDINSISDLEKSRIQFLGKKSLLISLMKSLSDLTKEEKSIAGKDLNNAKNEINSLLADKKILLSKSG